MDFEQKRTNFQKEVRKTTEMQNVQSKTHPI